MVVEKETTSARKLRNFGIILLVVISIFIFASLVLGLYDYSQYRGWSPLANFTNYIYAQTQYPILSSIWTIAARPDFVNLAQLKNLWFFGEISIFLVATYMTGKAFKTLRYNDEAKHRAEQQIRQDHYQKKR